GTLTVDAKGLTIAADSIPGGSQNPFSKTYGSTLTFAGTEFTASGLVNSDSVTSASLASAGAVATATVAGSPYAVTIGGAVGTGLGNYSITYTPGTLTLNAKGL